MTGLGRARIVRGSVGQRQVTSPVGLPIVTSPSLRRVLAEEHRARETAENVLGAARTEAAALLAQARLDAAKSAEEAVSSAREAEEAKAAALYLRIKHEDEVRAERDLDRAVTLGVVLAERLLGAALEREPDHVLKLARQALAEARGARRATIEASPLDAEVLDRCLAEVGFSGHLDVLVDPAMPRGSLRIVTNLGTLDARLRPQLERLASALRESLENT